MIQIAESIDLRGRPLPVLLRLDIAERIVAGKSRREVAKELQLARSTVDKYAAVKIFEQVQAS